jgi:hypothetical protein
MKEIKLSKDKTCYVDSDFFEDINKHEWHAAKRGKNFYAARTANVNGKKKLIYMHRYILKIEGSKMQVDHIDGNGLNNSIRNLRPCTQLENNRNKRKLNLYSSIYKGVHIHKLTGKWRAMITVNYKNTHIGLYDNEEEAALNYDILAKKLFGEFANLNFR